MGRPERSAARRGDRRRCPLLRRQAPPVAGAALLLWLALAGCGSAHRGACLDGGSRCAAAEAPPGMRSLRRGYRIGRHHWLRRTNRESGVPDVGLQAEWLPIAERR